MLGDGRMRDRALYCRKGAETQTPRTAVRANVARGSHRARGGVAARRCHAQCEAADVLTTVSVRSAPIIGCLRRLRAGEGPPVRAPPGVRCRLMMKSEASNHRIMDASCFRRFPLISPVRRNTQSRPSGRASRGGSSAARRRRRRTDHLCAADGHGRKYFSRAALWVTTARARSVTPEREASRATLAPTEVPRPLRFGARSTGRRRLRIRPSPSTAEGPPRPAPGGGHAAGDMTNHRAPRKRRVLSGMKGARVE